MNADDCKAEANKHFASKEYQKALDLYSSCLGLTSSNDVKGLLYSNRSACHLQLAKAKNTSDSYQMHLKDAMKNAKDSIECCPQFMKSYYRASNSAEALGDIKAAVRYLELGLKTCMKKESDTLDKELCRLQLSYSLTELSRI
jgi:tetratricopeptide (TPR) repeat protein